MAQSAQIISRNISGFPCSRQQPPDKEEILDFDLKYIISCLSGKAICSNQNQCRLEDIFKYGSDLKTYFTPILPHSC